MFELTP